MVKLKLWLVAILPTASLAECLQPCSPAKENDHLLQGSAVADPCFSLGGNSGLWGSGSGTTSADEEESWDLNQGTFWPDTASSTSTLDFFLVRVGGY